VRQRQRLDKTQPHQRFRAPTVLAGGAEAGGPEAGGAVVFLNAGALRAGCVICNQNDFFCYSSYNS